MIFPLRIKLSLLASVLLVLGIGTVTLLLLEQSTQALENEARKRGRFIAANLAQTARDAVLLEDDVVLAKLLENLASEAEVRVARLLRSDGSVIASSREETRQQFERYATEEPIATRAFAQRLIVAAQMTFSDVDLGEAQIVLDLEKIVGSVVARARRDVLLAGGGLLALGILIAFAVSGRITRPLQRLRTAVSALGRGDLSARVEVDTRDEVAELARAFNVMSQSLGQKDRVESAFRRYVDDHVLRQILDSPGAINLIGDRREVTVLFIDIRNFTRLSSSIGPERIVAFLNEVFELITNCLLEHGATVDKYIGDAVLAYFGAPIESSDHASRGIASAISIQRSVEERNAKCEAAGQPFVPIGVGIGIQSGPVVVGNIGSEFKADFTAIGDPVNVANRLQKMAGPGDILVTDEVVRAVDGVDAEPLGPQLLEGRDEPVEVLRVRF